MKQGTKWSWEYRGGGIRSSSSVCVCGCVCVCVRACAGMRGYALTGERGRGYAQAHRR